MTRLFLTEATFAIGPSILLNRATVAKKLVVSDKTGAKVEVEFRDGSPTGTLIARIVCPANDTRVLSCETNEVFNFVTNVTVVPRTTTSGVAGIYTMGNPSPSFT